MISSHRIRLPVYLLRCVSASIITNQAGEGERVVYANFCGLIVWLDEHSSQLSAQVFFFKKGVITIVNNLWRGRPQTLPIQTVNINSINYKIKGDLALRMTV